MNDNYQQDSILIELSTEGQRRGARYGPRLAT